MERKGYFIALEGIDGCGKTTQAKLVARELRAMGRNVREVREPGGTAIGERIRDILKDPEYLKKMFPMTSLLLFSATRYQFIHEVVKPALAEGAIVISDRCFLSTLAYQAHGEGIDLSTVRTECMRAMNGTIPDMMFILDVTVEEARERLAKENKDDRYEKMGDQFLGRVRLGYAKEAAEFRERTRVLSAHFPAEKVTADIMKNIRMLI